MIALSFIFLFLHFNQFDYYANAVLNPVTKPIISFCGGSDFGCAVFDNHQMKCWGGGHSFGSISDYGDFPSNVGDNIPYFNAGSSVNITKVTCSFEGICVLLNTGSIKCAGDNSVGQAGVELSATNIGAPMYIGDSLPAVKMGTDIAIISIVGGSHHNCALTTLNQIKCFGYNLYGQLGYGHTDVVGKTSTFQMGDDLPFVDFGADAEIASIHSGMNAMHNCVILSAPAASAQRIKCWGWNPSYQLGYGAILSGDRGDASGEMGDNLPLVDLGTESKVKQLVLGRLHTCAIIANDELKCFGGGAYGQLGSGSTSSISLIGNANPIVQVDSGKTIKLLAAGDFHTCIVYDDVISMKCFGRNFYGQLGQGHTDNRGDHPTRMIPSIPVIDLGTGLLQIASIHGGWGITCVVFVDGGVKCFGINDMGQLAIGSAEDIGHTTGQMGSNLEYAELFSPTQLPTKNPTAAPSQFPTRNPTQAPIKNPTASPSMSPSTFTPTILPSVTASPTAFAPTRLPSITSNPTKKPTVTKTNSPTTSAAIKMTCDALSFALGTFVLLVLNFAST